MTIDRRTWTTGALAVVITLVFAFVVFRAGREQGSVASVTNIVPQVAVGSLDNLTTYSTAVQIINAGAAAVTVSAAFYQEDGTAATLPMTTTASTFASFAGSFFNLALPANGVVVISAVPASGQSYSSLWGRITSTGAVTVISTFDLRDAPTGALYGRVGVAASDANMRRFVIPRTRNTASGLDTGFAIVNTGTTSAILNATLCCAVDGTVVATKSQEFMAGQKIAMFANSFFDLRPEAPGTLYQFMTFESTADQFAAIGLAVDGPHLTSAPVERLQ